MNFEDLSGQTALITGASGGLGLHFAQLLAQYGVSVTLAARRIGTLEKVCAQINATDGISTAVEMDVTDRDSIETAINCADKHFDIVINNAGLNVDGSALKLSEDEWDQVIDTNLKGAFMVSQAAARGMKDHGGGAIVNIASILGLRVAGNLMAYATSKAGMIQMTKSLALEWAQFGIRVNALCPGYIETDINRTFFSSDAGKALIKRIPQRRLGQASDLDVPLLLLCSKAGSYITGTTLAVDGGHLNSTL